MPTTSLVYFTSVADGQYQYDYFFFLDFADDTIVSYPISPQSGSVRRQRLAKMPRVFAALNMFLQVPEHSVPNRLVQFIQLTNCIW